MSKKPARAFRAPEDDDEVQVPASSKPEGPAAQTSEPAATDSSNRPAYRQGKKNLSIWLNDRAHRTIKALAAEEGVTLQEFLIGVLNRELAKKGRPQIAE